MPFKCHYGQHKSNNDAVLPALLEMLVKETEMSQLHRKGGNSDIIDQKDRQFFAWDGNHMLHRIRWIKAYY